MMGLLATTGPFKEKCNKQVNVIGGRIYGTFLLFLHLSRQGPQVADVRFVG